MNCVVRKDANLDSRRILRCIAVVAVIALSLLCSAGAALAQEGGAVTAAPQVSGRGADNDAVRALIDQYVQSVEAADTNLAAQIWSDSPDDSFIFPAGQALGFDEIKRVVYLGAMAGNFSQRQMNLHNVIVHVYGDTAWSEFDWDSEAKLKKDGSSITTYGMETQIYRKESAGWRLVHVHYSVVTPATQAQ
jgi:ketosteroid isomerase-like protein